MDRTRVLSVVALIVLGCGGLPLPSYAQSATTGAIAGVVRDPTGSVLPGVTVDASSPALIEKSRSAVTDDQGNYKIVDLRPGTYTVTFTLSGFNTFRREGIELSTGFTATANAEMKIGSLQETVTVTGASPIVDIQNVRTQNVLTREIIDVIPTGKTIQGYASLTVGAVVGSQDVGGNQGEAATSIRIHGGRDNDLKLYQDGMRTNNSQSGNGGLFRWFLTNQAQVQEVTLETGGMLAESETGGIQVNAVPKDGGNTFSVYLNTSGTSGSLQSRNISDALVARGISAQNSVRKIYDFGIGVGGPIRRDRLWFYTAHRWWGAQQNVPGNFYNATQGQYIGGPGSGVSRYTADTARQAFTNVYNEDHDGRLTWQATAQDKVTFTFNRQGNCNCFFSVDQNRAPEATRLYKYTPYLWQASWSHPVSKRLLLDAGLSIMRNRQDLEPVEGVTGADIAIQELSTGYRYNASGEGIGAVAYGQNDRADQNNGRFSVSYVTGSHAFKTGVFWQTGVVKLIANINGDVWYGFNLGVPGQITQWATPISSESTLGRNIGLFAQDQWTVQRVTLNLGVRFDTVRAYNPEQHISGGQFYPAYDFPKVDNVPNWKDISPRLGAAYDVFGDGKTAIKAYVGRYVAGQATAIAQATNPAVAMVTNATRTWNDNGNFIPECDLKNPAANGECQPLNNSAFGTVNQVTRYDPALLSGLGRRDYNWQSSVSVQRELHPGVAVTVGYFQTFYGNFTATKNELVAATDFTTYCITAPSDVRLPGGGGNPICGLYDVNPGSFGRVRNLVTEADNFGTQTESFNGVDASMRMRFGAGGLLQGGVSVGRTVTDNCYQNQRPDVTALGFAGGTPRLDDFCHVTPPWSAATQVKLNGIYPLPYGVQVSATFQNLPGLQILANRAVPNAQIAPALGRDLAAGPGSTATVALIPAGTLYEDRLTQVDLRVTKGLRLKNRRLRAMVDLYNVFNANTILSENFTYGSAWLRPTVILGGRLLKFGGEFSF